MLACNFHPRLAIKWTAAARLGLALRTTTLSPEACRRWVVGVAPLTCDDSASLGCHQGRDGPTIQPIPLHWPARLAKRRRVSPSTDLIDALRSTGHYAALPNVVIHKADLSYQNAISNNAGGIDPLHKAGFPALSLQAILAAYTRARQHYSPAVAEQRLLLYSPFLQQLRVSSQDIDDFLSARGYEKTDLEAWLAIIAEENTETAARRLISHSENTFIPNFKPLPVFVPLFLLRRPLIDAPALRYILQHIWQLLHRKKAHEDFLAGQDERWKRDYSTTQDHPIISQHTLVTAIVRLLRHATRWPGALVSITAMFTQHVKPPSQISSSQARRAPMEERLSRFCVMYNRILSLLALPSQSHPFHSVWLHQRAQFDVVKAMAMNKPPLAITREGYRAITQMQLASVKSERERDWEQLKAKSWPPWKEAKTGLDAEKETDYGTSRGLQAIRRAAEAGYGSQVWEKVARIMSGWDLDGSPTILTRAFVLHGDVSRKTYAKSPEAAKIWAARIRATRTVEEAWAGFLGFEDLQFGPNSVVYMAMFKKLLAERRRKLVEGVTQHDRLEIVGETLLTPLSAGDSGHVSSSSDSPNEAIYIRSPVPTLDALADKWLSSGLQPSNHVIAFLIENAGSLEQADKYLRHGIRVPAEVPHPLLHFAEAGGSGFDSIPQRLVTAYLILLCRLALRVPHDAQNLPHLQLSHEDAGSEDTPFLQAARRILTTSKVVDRRAWYAFIDALSREPSATQSSKGPARLRKLLRKYFFLRQIMAQMYRSRIPHREGEFMSTCRLLTAIRFLTPQKEENHRFGASLYRHANSILSTGRSAVQEQFYTLLTGKDSIHSTESPSDLPRLTHLPHPIYIHTLIRTLGKLGDLQGIVTCLHWMSLHESEISKAAQSPRNARKLLRWALVGARVFLDTDYSSHEQTTLPTANEEDDLAHCRSQGLELLKGFDSWGGWPSDHEAHLYCNYARSV